LTALNHSAGGWGAPFVYFPCTEGLFPRCRLKFFFGTFLTTFRISLAGDHDPAGPDCLFFLSHTVFAVVTAQVRFIFLCYLAADVFLPNPLLSAITLIFFPFRESLPPPLLIPRHHFRVQRLICTSFPLFLILDCLITSCLLSVPGAGPQFPKALHSSSFPSTLPFVPCLPSLA